MKKYLILLAWLTTTGSVIAQPPQPNESKAKEPTASTKGAPTNSRNERPAQRKFQILVKNVDKEKIIKDSNERFLELQASANDRAALGTFGNILWGAYSSSIVQKTVNATSNLVSLGVNYLTEAVKSDREKWYRSAQEQCKYSQVLSSESNIDDFYAAPSTKGAMDPENLKFEGFGCKNYIELTESPGSGVNVFYIFCKMRRDSLGISHIVNHSKFLVEVDTLIFVPQYCNLPNDPTGNPKNRFSFEKRNNLNMTLKARLYSSWMNQATMIANDQLLGEFTVHIKIDPKKLNDKGEFIYDKNDPDFEKLVTIEGDSYIVPRSYTGTTDAQNYQPSWGTGQYRIEMEVAEECRIIDSYYQIRESGNGKEVAFADATPGKKKWDKAKWKTEWNVMNERRKSDSVWKNMWQCIVTAYKGSSWTATLTDPLSTSLYSYETTKLKDAFSNLSEKLFTDAKGESAPATVPKMAGAAGAGAATPPTGGKPAGAGNGKPAGGSKPQ